MSNEQVDIRLTELNLLAGALENHASMAREWQAWLDEELERLIDSNNEEVRGRVKLLKRLLNWPIEVQEEIRNLQQELP